MKREDHIIYCKAILCIKNDNTDGLIRVLDTLELTDMESGLIESRRQIQNGFFIQARRLLIKLHVTSSYFLNAERAFLLGQSYSKLHDVIKCRYSYAAALKEYGLCEDRKGQFSCHILLAKSLLDGGLTPLALSHLKAAGLLALGRQEEIFVNRYMARLYIKIGNERKALIYIEMVLQHSEILSEKENVVFRKLASQFYGKIGKGLMAKKAIENLVSRQLEH